LTSKGFDVLSAENGQIALDIMSKEDVSILLLDLKMPIMGGEEVLEITGTRHPEIPVIIITGHGTVDTAVECMKKGAYDFITKPFQIEQSSLLEISKAVENPVQATEIINDESLLDTLTLILNDNAPDNKCISQEIESGGYFLRAISAPVLGPDADIVGAVTVLENITAFKQLDQMKSDFVNMVAHELRSPLVAIRQLNGVILDGLAGPLGKKQTEFINRGVKKIDALLELINDLLDVAKIEAGKYVQHLVPTDIGQIIRDLIALLEPRAENQGIDLSFSLKDMKPVQSDPKNMEEIFNNLISNAINYSPEGGAVTVTAQVLDEYMEIKVKDTGIGISPEELPKIFDKFYRVKSPKTRDVTGTGLGLAIVKGVVDAHHGTIDVESVVEQGTTFRILLPVITEAE